MAIKSSGGRLPASRTAPGCDRHPWIKKMGYVGCLFAKFRRPFPVISTKVTILSCWGDFSDDNDYVAFLLQKAADRTTGGAGWHGRNL